MQETIKFPTPAPHGTGKSNSCMVGEHVDHGNKQTFLLRNQPLIISRKSLCVENKAIIEYTPRPRDIALEGYKKRQIRLHLDKYRI